ncbi:MAG: hypothetical protein ACOC7L_00685 [Acidobacteriota bacterium]
MLRELGRALAESSDVNRTLRRLHDEGYGLFMFLERREHDADAGDAPAEAGERASLPLNGGGEPTFRINGGDLSFLRSIGIDPTRRIRRRKGGSPREPDAHR